MKIKYTWWVKIYPRTSTPRSCGPTSSTSQMIAFPHWTWLPPAPCTPRAPWCCSPAPVFAPSARPWVEWGSSGRLCSIARSSGWSSQSLCSSGGDTPTKTRGCSLLLTGIVSFIRSSYATFLASILSSSSLPRIFAHSRCSRSHSLYWME